MNHYYLYEYSDDQINKDIDDFVELRYLAVRGKLFAHEFTLIDDIELRLFGVFKSLEQMGIVLEKAYRQYRDRQNGTNMASV